MTKRSKLDWIPFVHIIANYTNMFFLARFTNFMFFGPLVWSIAPRGTNTYDTSRNCSI